MKNNYRYQVARRATLNSAIVNTILALLKVFAGYFGHSYALFADGIHSFSDLITDGLVIIAAKAGGRLPDKEHPYGHQRIETMMAIILSLILIAVAISIIYDAIHILFEKKQEIRPEIVVLFIAALSILAKEGLYQYTIRLGKKIESNLLISNAWHHRSDALTSLIVLVSVIGTFLGFHHWDAFGAFIIAIFIIKISIQILLNGIKELIDTAVDNETQQMLIGFIKTIPGVQAIHQLRSRMHGSNIFLDVHIIVDPFISVSEGHYIGEQVSLSLTKKFKNVSDVVVHVDPEDDETVTTSLLLPNRDAITNKLNNCWQGLPDYQNLNKIILHYLKGKIYVEIYFDITAVNNKNLQVISQSYNNAVRDIPEISSVIPHFTSE